ncbi:MAG: glycosyltransferase, partial [Bacteroidales bacterium]
MILSIVTINKDNKEGLQQTLESLKNQTSKEVELIVIDGNSKDG